MMSCVMCYSVVVSADGHNHVDNHLSVVYDKRNGKCTYTQHSGILGIYGHYDGAVMFCFIEISTKFKYRRRSLVCKVV